MVKALWFSFLMTQTKLTTALKPFSTYSSYYILLFLPSLFLQPPACWKSLLQQWILFPHLVCTGKMRHFGKTASLLRASSATLLTVTWVFFSKESSQASCADAGSPCSGNWGQYLEVSYRVRNLPMESVKSNCVVHTQKWWSHVKKS